MALSIFIFRDIKVRTWKMVSQQYRAWSDCTDVQAGQTDLYWWQRLITFRRKMVNILAQLSTICSWRAISSATIMSTIVDNFLEQYLSLNYKADENLQGCSLLQAFKKLLKNSILCRTLVAMAAKMKKIKNCHVRNFSALSLDIWCVASCVVDLYQDCTNYNSSVKICYYWVD